MAAKLWLLGLLFTAVSALDPGALLAPAVALSAADRARLDRGELVSRVLPARKGQVAVYAVAPIDVEPGALITAANDIADLKKSPLVTEVARFSDPPQLVDLEHLALDQHDRDVLAVCQVGRCSFKLSAIEIDSMARNRYGDVNGNRITAALRQVMLERVRAYRSSGLAALPPIANRSNPWSLHDVLAAAQAESPRLLREPPLSAWIEDHPVAAGPIESFLYWSLEHFGPGKPVILITHVATYQPSAGVAIVVNKQIFGSRYLDGALTMTAITTAASGQRYLVYLNRSTVDVLGGLFGSVKRSMLESRLAGEVPELIGRLRDRLERKHQATRAR